MTWFADGASWSVCGFMHVQHAPYVQDRVRAIVAVPFLCAMCQMMVLCEAGMRVYVQHSLAC
jgi:hypothetical protein